MLVMVGGAEPLPPHSLQHHVGRSSAYKYVGSTWDVGPCPALSQLKRPRCMRQMALFARARTVRRTWCQPMQCPGKV